MASCNGGQQGPGLLQGDNPARAVRPNHSVLVGRQVGTGHSGNGRQERRFRVEDLSTDEGKAGGRHRKDQWHSVDGIGSGPDCADSQESVGGDRAGSGATRGEGRPNKVRSRPLTGHAAVRVAEKLAGGGGKPQRCEDLSGFLVHGVWGLWISGRVWIGGVHDHERQVGAQNQGSAS